MLEKRSNLSRSPVASLIRKRNALRQVLLKRIKKNSSSGAKKYLNLLQAFCLNVILAISFLFLTNRQKYQKGIFATNSKSKRWLLDLVRPKLLIKWYSITKVKEIMFSLEFILWVLHFRYLRRSMKLRIISPMVFRIFYEIDVETCCPYLLDDKR